MTTTLENVRQSIAEAFPFEVCKLPLLGPDRERTPHYGLFRNDNGACVGNACRRGYEPHTLDDVQALAEAASIGFDAGRCGITCTANVTELRWWSPSSTGSREMLPLSQLSWNRVSSS